MIKVIASGIYTSVQDLGRKGYANIGVPMAGAMDLYAAKMGNYLLNNDENDAVLEFTLGGCKLAFLENCVICITGADFSITINGLAVPLNTVLKVEKGSLLSFGKRKYGVRTYLAVAGGFQTEKLLGSRSFYKGVTPHGVLKKDMLLEVKPTTSCQKTYSSIKVNQQHFQTKNISCFCGPEFYMLSKKQVEQLQNTAFTIAPENNRMGYQLIEKIPNNFSSMLTSAVLPGTVQLTPSGKLIVLMRDCQVTGGYPRVLQLTEKALNQLAQKTTNDVLLFKINS